MTQLETLPVLDLSLLDGDAASAASFRDQLRAATHEIGFFYLTGTGISPSLEQRMHHVATEFFDLPLQDKLAIENINSPNFRGYTRLGGERTQGHVDWREMIDICPETPAIPPADGVPDFERLKGPNQWPAALPELRAVAEEWQATLAEVGRKLLRAWAQALGEDESYFDTNFGDPFTLLKIVKYPGIEPTEESATDQGVGSHKDAGVLTLLWIEPGVAGLQVQMPSGDWIDAPPVPGAFVCNIGELLEYATQGYLKATTHRVVAPRAPQSRISIPFFFNPALDAKLPLVRLPPELATEARGITRDPKNPIHALYGENALKSRLRAHPDVAAIHHADLVARRAAEAAAGVAAGTAAPSPSPAPASATAA